MRRLSGRAQVEPIAALGAVFAVSLGLLLYAGALEGAVPADNSADEPTATLDSVQRAIQEAGVASPTRLDEAMAAVPDGRKANVTLVADGQQWQRGPAPPESATHTRRRVSVRLGPRVVEPGQLRVVVWR